MCVCATCVTVRSQSRVQARKEYLDKVAKSKKTLGRKHDELAQDLVEEIHDNITEEDLVDAQAADDEVRANVKFVKLCERLGPVGAKGMLWAG
jgi:transcription antitermination factor NusA-like protein